jgi:nitrite reductase/ring-hydroxylating ferredoxin subunit
VSANKIVSFEYAKSDAEKIPMVAYIRPSGKLFVGVSYCVPCKGTGQDIGSDGTLTCQTCGTKRDLESGVGISGACKLYPLDELPVKVQGDRVVVDKPALDNWTVQPTDRQIGGQLGRKTPNTTTRMKGRPPCDGPPFLRAERHDTRDCANTDAPT